MQPNDTPKVRESLIHKGTSCPANEKTVNLGSGVHTNNVVQPGIHNWHNYTRCDSEDNILAITKVCSYCGETILIEHANGPITS